VPARHANALAFHTVPENRDIFLVMFHNFLSHSLIFDYIFGDH
jgi:hypothetical protein